MKIAMILQSKNPERIWNAFRLGILLLQAKHSVRIFLMSEGVEIEEIPDEGRFDVSKKIEEFREQGGELLACVVCLQGRGKSETSVCPVGHLTDLVTIIEESDKVLTFD